MLSLYRAEVPKPIVAKSCIRATPGTQLVKPGTLKQRTTEHKNNKYRNSIFPEHGTPELASSAGIANSNRCQGCQPRMPYRKKFVLAIATMLTATNLRTTNTSTVQNHFSIFRFFCSFIGDFLFLYFSIFVSFFYIF